MPWTHVIILLLLHHVILKNITSELLSLTKGVTQGSVHSPELFTLYVDILSLVFDSYIHLYADYAILYFVNSVQLAVQKLQFCVNNLQSAFMSPKLIYANKAKFVIFLKSWDINFQSLQICTLTGNIIERALA